MKANIVMDATDLTQLSSREQLSALMDGALPADETRFLLRRLKHDESLAQCWERWRLSAEVMRGLAPARRLPTDFASRVAASLRGEQADGEALHAGASAKAVATGAHAARTGTWLRWGGGAAVAASLAVVALMSKPAVVGSPGNFADTAAVAVADTQPSRANSTSALSPASAPSMPARTPELQASTRGTVGMGFDSQAAQAAALASAVAVAARPARNNRRGDQPQVTQATSMPASTTEMPALDGVIANASHIEPLLPRGDITTRPWPRSVLPQYGNHGLTVGLGDGARSAAPYNPFQVRTSIGNLPPASIAQAAAKDPAASGADETTAAGNGDSPQP